MFSHVSEATYVDELQGSIEGIPSKEVRVLKRKVVGGLVLVGKFLLGRVELFGVEKVVGLLVDLAVKERHVV